MFAIFLTSKHKKITWTLFIAMALMGMSRNYLIVHYFSDVLAGYIVGAVGGVAGFYIVKGVYKPIYKHQNNKFCAFVLNADVINLFKRNKKMKIAVLVANGSEEIETLTPVDVIRRTGAECDLVSVGEKEVTLTHGVKITADKTVEEVDLSKYKAIVVPGGMPGATNISTCEKAVTAIGKNIEKGGLVAAICASPAVVLADNELLKSEKATCFPADEFITALGEKYTGSSVEVSGNIITANGPKSALEFSLAICDYLQLTPKI
jgi:4-methyl-5(b-hydroxyethyl)-thiazole monophosphate biosynthesis